MNYKEFIKSKRKQIKESGFSINKSDINGSLFEFQKFILKKALKKGRYAIFADCGLGKTIIQLEWSRHVADHTGGEVLILAPLAVTEQTEREAEKFGISLDSITITNYEQLDNLTASDYSGIVLDESSILKNFSGSYRNRIIERFISTPYKLACTATPSPNDELEIGNHAEFLNVMSSQDMRAMFFTTDKNIINGNKYRLKNYAVKDFYSWVSSWAVMLSKPSDLGFDDEGYELADIKYLEHKIKTERRDNGQLFNSVKVSATDFNKELRRTKKKRLALVKEIVDGIDDNVIIWIKHNNEADYLKEILPDAVNVTGSDSPEYKKEMLYGFSQNKFKILITKSKIAQFGLNYQNCSNQIFASLDFSFESLYQSVRRSHRFGQKNTVNVHLITTDTMQNVIDSINEKQEKFIRMQDEMRKAILDYFEYEESIYRSDTYETDYYKLINGDCVEEVKKLDDNSIDYSFFSPPFGAMYVFSNDPKDMSNVKDNDEFLDHFRYLVKELLRVIKPGRLVSIHMMQSTTLKGRDGFYSIKDFRGDLIRLFQDEGFYFHGENMIRKDPKTAAIRTKNRQLMWGTTKKDSSVVRPGLADYILTFRKPGENEFPIQNEIPFDLWCKIAEPVWIDVEEGDTIDYRQARSSDDERHITATQLKPIEWSYMMWCNKGETVLSPFSGVASEGHVAVKTDRKYIGIELKREYHDFAEKNLRKALNEKAQLSLI